MDIFNLFKKLVLVLVLFGAFCSQAFAVLDLTFSDDVSANKERIQFFWRGESSTANLAGYGVSAAGLPLDLKTNKAVLDANNNKLVHFGCSDDYPNSVKINVRLWDTPEKNHFYTAIAPFDNSSAGVVDNVFSQSYAYIKATPSTPIITKYSETGTTTTLLPAKTQTASNTVTFYSTAPLVEGKTVELKKSIWEITQGMAVVNVESANSSSLDFNPAKPPAGLTAMKTNDSVSLRVKYVNLWDTEGPFSESAIYTLGGGGGGIQSFTLQLESGVPNKAGINFFSMPFSADGSGNWYGFDDQAIKTAYDLVNQINKAAKTAGVAGNVVSTFGNWDQTNQLDAGITIPGNDPEDASAKAKLQALVLQQGKGYQVYISGAAKVELLIKNSNL